MYKRQFLLLFVAGIFTIFQGCAEQQSLAESPIDFVDPFIGTGTSTTASTLQHSVSDTEPKGQTFPAVGMPFGMTHWTPQTRATEQKCVSPYYYDDDEIQGFRGSHWMSGSCTQDYGSVTIMPVTGPVTTSAEVWGSSFQHRSETATPAYYSVDLDDYDITMEVTGTERSAIMQFRYHEADSATILIHPNSDENQGYVEFYPELNAVVGYNPVHRIYQGWGEPSGFSGHFVILFEDTFSTYGTWEDDEIIPSRDLADGGGTSDVGAWVKLPVNSDGMVRLMVGTSFTSMDRALKNLDGEIPNWEFDDIRRQAEDAWNRELGSVSVSGGSNDEKTMFYTALYHSMILPRIYSDRDGSYPGFAGDKRVHVADDFTYYGDFSMWDTFRAIHPLYTLLLPERARNMMQSLVTKAEQGGWMPIFPCWNNYTAAMIGDHVISPLTDAYTKGITGFDVESAYALSYQNATQMPSYDEYVDGKGRRALNSYLDYGYVPLEDSVKEAFHQQEQVSRTLEYAYDDFVLAQLANQLGKDDDYAMLIERAEYYKNVFDTTTGFVRGRHADGSWAEPFDPREFQPYITEGTPWHYTWFVPHDVRGLMQLMGGEEIFINKLDTLFHEGLYWHGNEPGHHIVYLYNWGQEPWKTQRWVREIMASEYGTGPGGLSGNDDTGQMSAWYVFSALGMYPVAPGVPFYAIGTPTFEKAAIQVGANGTFTIRANNVSDENMYIQSATLNGEPFNRTFIWHNEITAGGELVFEMGNVPAETWGIGADAVPPSMSD